MGYFDKLSEYYKSQAAQNDTDRFVKQVKGSYVSTAIIIGILIVLILIIIFVNAVSSMPTFERSLLCY